MSDGKLKPMPALLSDEDAERFVETADLSEHDPSGFKPMRFEFAQKDERADMRLPLGYYATSCERLPKRRIATKTQVG